MRDDLPNQVHMFLCAAIPLGIAILLHGIFALSFGFAASVGIVAGFVAMFTVTPLTFKIYSAIIEAKSGKVPQDTVVHRTDAGCSSLIFVALVLILYPAIINARQKLDAKLKKQNSVHQQLKP